VNDTPIIWFTGMSGSGKSTLSVELTKRLQNKGYKVQIIDGDTIRDNYTTKLGFSRQDVLTNNLNIAQKCLELRNNCDVILVPVISPYQKARTAVRKLLTPNFHLIYLKATLDSLKERDPKGLYALADRGDMTDLIGYSQTTPYEVPDNAALTLETSNQNTLCESTLKLFDYVSNL
jgi:adenylylsulfate kinase